MKNLIITIASDKLETIHFNLLNISKINILIQLLWIIIHMAIKTNIYFRSENSKRNYIQQFDEIILNII